MTKPASEALQTYTQVIWISFACVCVCVCMCGDVRRCSLQSVLDSTYHQECCLVEGNFPDDTASTEITAIIGLKRCIVFTGGIWNSIIHLCFSVLDSVGRPVSLCGAEENVIQTHVDNRPCVKYSTLTHYVDSTYSGN